MADAAGTDFTAFDAWNTGGGALTNATSGVVDTSFPNVEGSVYASAADGNGGFYIGGSFTHVDGIARNNAAHINADGSLDPTWNPNANSSVYAIAVSGSTIYLGGNFTTINGSTARYYVAAVNNTDGAVLGQWPTAYVPAVTPPVVPPVVARVLPAAPTKLHWLIGRGTTNQPIVATFTAAPNTTYTITATSNTTRHLQTRATRTARGTCKITTNKKTKKRTAKCTIRLRQAGTWLVKITPTQSGISGTPATKTIKISTPKPAGTALPPQPVTG